MPTTLHEPTTWAEVQEALFTDTYNARLGRYKSRYAYRGLSTLGYDLSTSLMRLGGDYASVEQHLLRQFRKYAASQITVPDNDWHWLSVAQHYGLPTRLLDWTYSPLVALHFATSNVSKFGEDGVVWMVNYKETHQALLPKAASGVLEDQKTWIFTAELIDEEYSDLDKLEAAGRKKPFALFFEPPSIDQRLFNQFGYFSITTDPTQPLDALIASTGIEIQKVRIPADLKWEIRDKLDQSNISERVLFPGISGIASWLTRYYAPKR